MNWQQDGGLAPVWGPRGVPGASLDRRISALHYRDTELRSVARLSARESPGRLATSGVKGIHTDSEEKIQKGGVETSE